MTTARWQDFYAHVAPLVPGCPYPVIDHHLRLAAQEFCERTLCWRAWMDAVTTSATRNRYDLNIDSGQEVVQLLRATLDGEPIDVLAQDEIPTNWQEGVSSRRGIFTLDRIEFIVLPQPEADLPVLIEAVVKPSNTGAGVDDTIARQYMLSIATGAVASIHAIPGQTFSNANSAYPEKFETLIARAASEVFHSYSRAPRRVRGQYM